MTKDMINADRVLKFKTLHDSRESSRDGAPLM